MKITDKISKAIAAYVDANGGSMRLVDALGVNNATAIRIGKGRSKTVRASTWKKLEPLIRPYLDDMPGVSPPVDEITAAIVEESKALTVENRRAVYRYAVETRIKQNQQ